MTDIYVGQKRSNTGCLLIVLAVTALVCGVYYLAKLRPRRAPKEEKTEEIAPVTEPETPQAVREAAAADPGLNLISEARRLKSDGDLLGAREKAYEVLASSENPVAIQGAVELLGEVNIDLVFSPRSMPEKVEYTVQPGDSLGALAKKFNTTIDAIRKGNRITGSISRVNDRLRVCSGTFAITVNKTDNTLDVYLNDRLFKRYRVGTGEFGRTPVGDFKIMEKIAQPTWWRPDGKAVPYGDTNNVLGTHWLSLNLPGYGIHGTWEPETIGKQASAGCIRLLNEDVEELYALVPEGTPVKIVE